MALTRGPVWARHGCTLYFIEGRTMMAVAIDDATTFDCESQVEQFDVNFQLVG
jgi:hypothetical protein